MDKIKIRKDEKTELINNAKNLGDTQPPSDLSEEKTGQVVHLIKSSFVRSYNGIIYICVALSWLGALIAFFSVKKGIFSG